MTKKAYCWNCDKINKFKTKNKISVSTKCRYCKVFQVFRFIKQSLEK